MRVYPWLLLFLFSCVADAAERPNILWLSVEDMSPHLGCYGDELARTPNVDAFAKQSILYENAFVCAPVCAPCRSSIITGVYPTSLGTHNMRSTVKLPPEIRPFTHYLRDAGYYCTNNSKEDYQFKTPKGTWDQSDGKAHWQNRPDKEQPFFAVFNYTGTHESAVRGDEPKYSRVISNLNPEELHDPAKLELPPYYPDTPKVREDWARYYNCITAMDKWVAERLAELDESGEADNTIVFFWSDHGVGLPRGKRWLYDSGIKVPLVVRMPDKFCNADETAKRTDELISLIDLPPTVLNLAGLAIPTYMQGRAFLGENLSPEREYIYAARDRMDERYDMIRCVRTKRYKYIRNFMPWRPYAQWISYAERGATMKELRRLHAEGKLTDEQELFMAKVKPVDEVYDLKMDPHELHNLLADRDWPGNEEIDLLLGHLAFCRMSSRDLGILPESKLPHLEAECGSRYGWFFRAPLTPIDENSLRTHVLLDFGLFAAFPDRNFEHRVHNLKRNAKSPHSEVRYWSAIGIGLPVQQSVMFETEIPVDVDVRKILKSALNDRNTAVRIIAAEMLAQVERKCSHLDLLLDALENADSPWDRLQAGNVLDLLPDFDDHADELRPVVLRVQAQLKDEIKSGPAENRQGLGYVERCVTRLAERLESP